MIFYHGTSQENWDKIQKEGVLWGIRNAPSRCTYLAVEKKHAVAHRKPNDVVLKIDYDPTEERWCNNYIDGEWVELEGVVNTKNNTITASVKHFTTFAIIGTVIIPKPVPVVTIPEPTLPVPTPTPEPVVPPILEPSPEPVKIEPEVTPITPIEPRVFSIWVIVLIVFPIVAVLAWYFIRRRAAKQRMQ